MQCGGCGGYRSIGVITVIVERSAHDGWRTLRMTVLTVGIIVILIVVIITIVITLRRGDSFELRLMIIVNCSILLGCRVGSLIIS